ncbi:probable ADP-ribosylation factor GTPase-activating protein AGD14 isoform X6 [Coffea arabica]|uniref:Probable ADP-ribosylation factor GTPase-activating protein AGD14 isoform X6 n=1 Tax=Coffea arabica TaxID=13443 RepID=A0A6P6SXQ3_COFAR|nr:probable ADP-ribosylation factor GTPase-activating protein AGD14 isoform X3 [Coffea arabica]
MSSRKEEERNEKIIRGLMKLPPNRRCINCNSLGPQYVCTNFWTFVCMTCSGIHREFTHRVKSVSMAKFTFQEVEALQNGGNQRAREVYLKHWDSQRQRLPDNSNAEKVREFIRNVYVMKKYVGGGSFDRPPRDSQIARSHEDETRRASSYHSYSQSPPYDFQYEERQYGRHAPVLTRKPGSDRGLYEGKVSSFLSPSRLSDRSPSRLSDHIYEDRFGFGRSNSRVSDYSSSAQSPNFQKDIGSPSSETSREFCGEDIAHNAANRYPDSYANRGSGQMLYPQQLPKPNQSSSMDLFSEIPQQPPAASLDDKSLKVIPQNEGWATFDTPQHSAPVGNVNSAVLEVPSDKNPGQSFNPLLSLNQWPSFENNSSNGPSSSMPPWGAAWQIVEAKPRIEPWNAFEESYGQLVKRSSEQVVNQSSFAEQYLYRESEGFNNGEIPTVGRDTLPPIATVSSEMSLSQHQHDAPIPPVMGGHSHALGPKSTNPFDLPYDAKIESENMSNFWDVSSLQAALPNGQMSTPFTAGANEHWFAQEPMVSYVPAGSDGALGFLVGQAPSTQMSNVPSHGPVASVGGNPFA